jgi:hypothetical protein
MKTFYIYHFYSFCYLLFTLNIKAFSYFSFHLEKNLQILYFKFILFIFLSNILYKTFNYIHIKFIIFKKVTEYFLYIYNINLFYKKIPTYLYIYEHINFLFFYMNMFIMHISSFTII